MLDKLGTGAKVSKGGTTGSVCGDWAGWVRPAGSRRWERVVQAASWAEAWAGLLSHRAAGEHAEKIVLAKGQDPNIRRARRW